MAAICPNFSYSNSLSYTRECVPDDAPQEAVFLSPAEKYRLAGTGIGMLFACRIVAVSPASLQRINEAFATSVSRRSNPLFLKIAVVVIHTLSTAVSLAAMPAILSKVVQTWNMSDLSEKTADFVLHVMWGGFFIASVVFWAQVLIFDDHRREMFGMPINFIRRPIEVGLLQALPEAAPGAAPAA